MITFDRKDWVQAGWAAIIAPFSVVLHELGHFLVGLADGAPVQFNPTSVTPIPGQPIPEPSIPGLGQAAGPLVTLFLTFGAVLLIRRLGPRSPLIAMALTAPARMLVMYGFLAFTFFNSLRNGPPARPNFDEYNAAVALGLPVLPTILLLAILLPIAWWAAVREVPRGKRLRTVLATVLGGIVGLVLWVQLIGPALLG